MTWYDTAGQTAKYINLAWIESDSIYPALKEILDRPTVNHPMWRDPHFDSGIRKSARIRAEPRAAGTM